MAIQNQYDAFNQYAPQSLARAAYSNFTGAGIDQFTTGSAQNPASFLDLTNVLPAVNGGFQRRWGIHDLVAVNSFIGAVRTFTYNVPQDASNPSQTSATDLLLTTDNANWQVLAMGATGSPTTPLANVLNASPFTGYGPSAFPAFADVHASVSRNWFYYSDGSTAFRKVNPGFFASNTDTNCGITAPTAYVASGVGTNSTITAYGGTGKGYTSPSVTISGGGGTGATCTATIRNGTITAFVMTAQGSGYTSAPSVEITDANGTGAGAIAIYDSQGAITAVLPTGPIVLNAQRTYTYAFQNSVTGHTSDIAQGIISTSGEITSYSGNAATVISPALGVTGNVPLGLAGFTDIFVHVNPIQPIDAQVDTVVLMATSDGGSLERLYQVAIIKYTGTPITYDDTVPDTYLSAGAVASQVQAVTIDAANAHIVAGDNTGVYSVTSGSAVLSTQSFNSLMFGTHPNSLIPGYTNGVANLAIPLCNQALTAMGTWSSDVPVNNTGTAGGSHVSFQMGLTGNIVIQVN